MTILMYILLITIDPSSGEGRLCSRRPTLEQRIEPPRGPEGERKEEEHERRNQYCEGCYHPLIQGNGSDENLPGPVGLGLNEDVI